MAELSADRMRVYNDAFTPDEIKYARIWMARFRDSMLMSGDFERAIGLSKIIAMLAELMERRGMEVPEVTSEVDSIESIFEMTDDAIEAQLQKLLSEFHNGSDS